MPSINSPPLFMPLPSLSECGDSRQAWVLPGTGNPRTVTPMTRTDIKTEAISWAHEKDSAAPKMSSRAPVSAS